jgi:hypothetical protein
MRLRFVFAVAAVILGQSVLRAEHARIDLTLERVNPVAPGEVAMARASVDVDPPVGGLQPRPLLKVKAGEPLVLQFFFTNTYPHGTIKEARVHYFVVREAKARQKPVPDLKEGVLTQGSFTLNFKPKARVGARVTFKLPKPGVYLLRVQSENTQSDHEHFSAIDVQAE